MEDRSSSAPAQRRWLERLSQILLGEPKDREQLMELLRSAHERNLLDIDSLDMIEGVFEVSETRVRDIMVPRSQMVVVNRDQSLHEMLPIIHDSGHSRFPVTSENRDTIMGILLAKDLLGYFINSQEDEFDLLDIIRPTVFVPESKRLNVLLNEFKKSHNHIAIIVDEYGGVSGLVTIEDVLEQIVGEIDDEHDTAEEAFIYPHADNRFTVKALTPIEEFNEYFGTQFSDKETDTLGGLVLNRFGHLPKRGETIEIDQFSIKITRADKRRIHLLQVVIQPDTFDQRAV